MMTGYNSICIVGVDGTGKSTIVKMITEMFRNETSVVQYMGQKNWETGIAKAFAEHPRKILRVIRPIAIIVEYYHRVYKHEGSHKIVIFDRYVDEAMIVLKDETDWKRKMIAYVYKFFLGNRFYRPTVTFYLTCDIDVSLQRKDDINSEEQVKALIGVKKKLDEYYMNQANVVINTGLNSIGETRKIIRQRLQKEQCFCKLLI